MKISLSDILVAIVLSTSLSLVVIPAPRPFPHQGQAIGAAAAAMMSPTQAMWRKGQAKRVVSEACEGAWTLGKL